MDPGFHVVYTKFGLYCLNVAAEMKSHQTKQSFSNRLLPGAAEPL